MSNENKISKGLILNIRKWLSEQSSTLRLYKSSVQNQFQNLKLRLNTIVLDIKKWFRRKIADIWLAAYRSQSRVNSLRFRYGRFVFPFVLILLVFLSAFFSPTIQKVLNEYYPNKQLIDSLHSLILNVGCALIGTSTVVTALVLFAMQVNIERMPHGLFRRLSDDWRLLGGFALTFFLAISVATLSIFINQERLVFVTISSFWAVIFIFILFLYAYRRALFLINPLKQIGILICNTTKELRNWGKMAKRTTPLLDQEESMNSKLPSINSNHDLARTIFFRKNKHWNDGATRALRHECHLHGVMPNKEIMKFRKALLMQL